MASWAYPSRKAWLFWSLFVIVLRAHRLGVVIESLVEAVDGILGVSELEPGLPSVRLRRSGDPVVKLKTVRDEANQERSRLGWKGKSNNNKKCTSSIK